MKPQYETPKKNHYSSHEKSPDFLAPEKVYEEIGYDMVELLKRSGSDY